MATSVLDQGASFPPTGLEMSAWTPKSNRSFNTRLFQERFELIKKWFEAWSKDQKWQLIEYVLFSLSDEDIVYLHSLIGPLFPPPPPPPPPLPKEIKEDFTRVLPRILSMKIFSYLDPRSLCRASQVSWHWHSLTQHNVLWRPKCLKYSWFLPNQHHHHQQVSLSDPNTLWKRHYIDCVQAMFWKPSNGDLLLSQTPPTSVHNPTTSTPSSPSHPVDTPTSSPPVDRPKLDQRSSANKGHQLNISRPFVTHRPPWIHSSRFPKDLIKTSLSKELVIYENYSIPSKKLQVKSVKRKPGISDSNTVHYESPVESSNITSEENDSSDQLEEHLQQVLSTSSTDSYGSIEEQHETRQAMLDPALIDRMRVHVPCSDQSITVSTINGATSGGGKVLESRRSLEESFEYIHQTNPFPKLKPYYIETFEGDVHNSKSHDPHTESSSSIEGNQSIHKNTPILRTGNTKLSHSNECKPLLLLHRNLTDLPVTGRTVGKVSEVVMQPLSQASVVPKTSLAGHQVIDDIRGWTNEDFNNDDTSSESDIF